MVEPFISNHQYNLIFQQANLLQQSLKTVADPKVIAAVRYSAETRILEQFPNAPEFYKQMLGNISALNRVEEFQDYLNRVEACLMTFPRVTADQIKRLFPKTKKLKLPDLEAIDFRYLTYLGWVDVSANKIYIVYPYGGKDVGIEGRYTPTHKKNLCALCNGYGEVALVTAVTKAKHAISPDYYKSVGNYMCVDSEVCNKKLTDVSYLERFIREVTG